MDLGQDAVGDKHTAASAIITFKAGNTRGESLNPPTMWLWLDGNADGKRQCVDWNVDYMEVRIGDADYPRIEAPNNQLGFDCAPGGARFYFSMPMPTAATPSMPATILWYPHNGPMQEIPIGRWPLTVFFDSAQ